MRVVAALGGNALLERGELPGATVQEEHVLKAALALAPRAQAHELVLTHGNGLPLLRGDAGPVVAH